MDLQPFPIQAAIDLRILGQHREALQQLEQTIAAG